MSTHLDTNFPGKNPKPCHCFDTFQQVFGGTYGFRFILGTSDHEAPDQRGLGARAGGKCFVTLKW